MKIHHCKQGSPEWHELRARNFTASELGPWIMEPVKITLNVDQLKAELDRLEIPRKGITKREDLIAILPNPENYMELCDGAKTAIIDKISGEKAMFLRSIDPEELTIEDQLWLARYDEMKAQRDRSFEYNVPVKYGNLLEPFARSFYESVTGYEVEEVGFIECDGYGCSPDGLVSLNSLDNSFTDIWHHGLEIKCPIPETHLAWLDAGVLPDCHKLQVHASMACSGLDEWHFLSYCPGDAPLRLIVKRDHDTEKIEAGLKIIVSEKAKMKAKFSQLWKNNYSAERKSPSTGATE